MFSKKFEDLYFCNPFYFQNSTLLFVFVENLLISSYDSGNLKGYQEKIFNFDFSVIIYLIFEVQSKGWVQVFLIL